MKKLMIAVAIVCAAAMSQAASITWGNWAYYSDAEGNIVDTTTAPYNFVLVCLGSTESYEGLTSSNIRQDGGWDVGEGGEGFNSVGGEYLLGTDKGDHDNYFYALMAKDDKGNLLQLKYVGGDNDGEIIEALKIGSFEKDGTYKVEFWAGENGDTMTVAAVPEPTSGLLLLLGVAGLALRRRRA